MPQRQTERDTYGGERRWQEGAGERWTSTEHKRKPQPGTETDPESARVSTDTASQGGVLEQLADELGITRPEEHQK